MRVELIVIDGLLRGTIAPIRPGYYLIGRHDECQIRPESRSVSRRHCLLWHTDEALGAFDLNSRWGTFVNNRRIEPYKWKVLNHGDVLKVGVFAFGVSISPDDSDDVPPLATGGSRLTGDRLTGETPTPISSGEDTSVSLIDEEPVSPADVSPEPDTSIGERVTRSPREGGGAPESTRRRTKTSQDTTRRFKKRSAPSFSLPKLDSISRERWSLIAIVAVLIAVGCFFTYQLISYQSGPNIEVRKGLD